MKTNSLDKAPRMNPAKGVEIRILGNTDKVMLTHVVFQSGAVHAEHSHPQDQIGTCLQGEGELISGGKKLKTVPGVSWCIQGGEPHSWKSTAKGETIMVETFSPPREDYISKAK
jgi:quercetin dioxygenase-like cupin family protein